MGDIDRYPPNPIDGDAKFADRLREIERRINELDSRNPVAAGAVVRGTNPNAGLSFEDDAGVLRARLGFRSGRIVLEFFDDTGNPIVTVGEVSSTVEGIRVFDDAGSVRVTLGRVGSDYAAEVRDAAEGLRFYVGDDGYRDPWLAHPTVVASAFTVVTGAVLAPVYQSRVELITHKGLSVTVIATGDAGTTGEVRIRNVATGSVTSTVAVPAGGQLTQTFQWLHGATLGTGPVRFDLEARRTGGAGNVNVFQPYELSMADPLQCTATGL